MNLTGEWEGYYIDLEVDAEPFPIRAKLEDKNGRVQGFMEDLRPTWDTPIANIVEAVPLDSPHLTGWQQMEIEHPKAVLRSQLPKDSWLKGQVHGSIVAFRKEYCGSLIYTWIIDGSQKQTPPERDAGYLLEYSGEMAADGQSIVGQWSVYELAMLGFRKTKVRSGDFRLDRK